MLQQSRCQDILSQSGFQSSSVLQSVPRLRRQVETTTEADTTPTTTETPTTTAEPLPYDINYLMVPSVSRHLEIERACTLQVSVVQSVVYLLRPQLQVEGSYPIIVPIYDKERNLNMAIFTA